MKPGKVGQGHECQLHTGITLHYISTAGVPDSPFQGPGIILGAAGSNLNRNSTAALLIAAAGALKDLVPKSRRRVRVLLETTRMMLSSGRLAKYGGSRLITTSPASIAGSVSLLLHYVSPWQRSETLEVNPAHQHTYGLSSTRTFPGPGA